MKYVIKFFLLTLVVSSCSQPYPDVTDETVRQQFLDNNYENLALLYAAEGELCYIGQKVGKPSVLRFVWVLDNANLKSFPVNKDLTLLWFSTNDGGTTDVGSNNATISVTGQNELQTYLKYDGYIPNISMDAYQDKLSSIALMYADIATKEVVELSRIVGKADHFVQHPPAKLNDGANKPSLKDMYIQMVDAIADITAYDVTTGLPLMISDKRLKQIVNEERDDIDFVGFNKTTVQLSKPVEDQPYGDLIILGVAGLKADTIVIIKYNSYYLFDNDDCRFCSLLHTKVKDEFEEQMGLKPAEFFAEVEANYDTISWNYINEGVRYIVQKGSSSVFVSTESLKFYERSLMEKLDSLNALPQ